jgi:ribosomal protein S27AE
MIAGPFVSKFKYANMACMVDVPLNGDYDFWYDIVKLDEGDVITLEKRGKEFTKKIQTDSQGQEYFFVDHIGLYEEFVKGGKPSQIKCLPLLDSANSHKFVPEKIPPKTEAEKRREDKETKAYRAKLKKAADSSTWKSKCAECGGVMDYHNFSYHCRRCGNTLEV